MRNHWQVLSVLVGVAVTGWSAAIAAPTTALTVSPTTSVSSTSVNTPLPPAGGQMSPGGVGGQASSTRPGGQFMPGTSPGGQLAPGQIPGGSASGGIPALPTVNPFLGTTNFLQLLTPIPRVIVTGNSSATTTAPGGTISGNGVGGKSKVIVTGGNTTTAPGGVISGNGVGGSRVIVTGAGTGNITTTPIQSNVIVTGNGLTGVGIGGTNSVPVLR